MNINYEQQLKLIIQSNQIIIIMKLRRNPGRDCCINSTNLENPLEMESIQLDLRQLQNYLYKRTFETGLLV